MNQMEHIWTLVQCILLLAKFSSTSANDIVAERSSNVELSCKGRGYLTWTRIRSNNGIDEVNESQLIGHDHVLILTNVTLVDAGIYRCVDERGNTVNEERVVVGEAPERPYNLSCITHHSLYFMHCCWQVGRSSGISTNFSLSYTKRMVPPLSWIHGRRELEGNETVGSCVKRSSSDKINTGGTNSRECCEIATGYAYAEDMDSPEFNIKLRSSNALGSKESGIWKEYPFNWIKPTSTRNLRLRVEQKDTKYLLIARWEPPDMTIKHFEYKLRYRTTPGDGSWHVLKNIKEVVRSFEVRRSHCLVEVQTAAAPDEELFKGYFSDWSQSAYNSTGVIRPMTRLRFQNVNSDIFDGSVTISARWVGYGRTDEIGFHYRIELYYCNAEKFSSENISDARTSYKRAINSTTECIVVNGSYCNVMGCSEAASVEMRPLQVHDYGVIVRLEEVGNGLVVSWNFSLLVDPSITCVARLLSIYRRRENQTEYMIRKEIAKKNVPCVSGTITITDNLDVCTEYVALVSTNNVTRKKIHGRSFQSEINKVLGSSLPTTLIAWEASATSDANIEVSWSAPDDWDCSKIRPRIFYKAVNASVCIEQAETCSTEHTSAPLECNGVVKLDGNSIIGGTTYLTRMAACCINKFSYKTGMPICLETNPAGGSKVITTEKRYETESSISIALSAIGIIAMIVVTAFAFSKRRDIKLFVKRTVWPRIPKPNLAVEFDSVDSDAGMIEMETFQRVLIQPPTLLENGVHGHRADGDDLSRLLPDEGDSDQACDLASSGETMEINFANNAADHTSDTETTTFHEDTAALLKTIRRDENIPALQPFRTTDAESSTLYSTVIRASDETAHEDDISIPPYLSCSNAGTLSECGHLRPSSSGGEDGSSEITTPIGLATERPLFFGLSDADLN